MTDININGKEFTYKYTENFAKLFESGINVKLNLTITNYQPEYDPAFQLEYEGEWYNSRLLAKEEVKMNYEGDWSIFEDKFELNLNYDKNLYEIDTSALEEIAKVNKTDLFQFETKWSEKKNKNIGLIVGVTVACVVVVAVIVVVVVIVVKKKQKIQSSKENS